LAAFSAALEKKRGIFMAFDQKLYDSILDEFTLESDELREIAADFRYDLRQGLKDPKLSSLKMLKSYVGLPTRQEKGEYLALDFGGTNVRVLRIRLEGDGKFTVLKKVAKPLVVPGSYNYINKDSSAEQMFGFIAGLVDEAVEGDHTTKFYLGHTFSFPSYQTDIYNAKLLVWTKEFATPGVEGKVVNDLLKAALHKKGLDNVEPNAVINDTVAVQLAAAYKFDHVNIGCIYATGHNTCYLEPFAGKADQPMILNLESGGFSKVVPNRFDNQLDAASEKPGEQRLEKMVSGRYMGELFGIALAELLGEAGKAYGFTSIDMSAIMEDEDPEAPVIRKLVKEKTGREIDAKDAGLVQDLVLHIVNRSARLVAASFVGILWQLQGDSPLEPQTIAVDGSVYEKMPHAKENLMKGISELLGEDAAKVQTVLENGGSGLGAAIAAAVAAK
jgi:hexokinase